MITGALSHPPLRQIHSAYASCSIWTTYAQLPPTDGDHPASLSTHPIERGHPLVSVWESQLDQRVMALVCGNGDGWCAVTPIRRGWDDEVAERCPATVCITLKEGTAVEAWAGVAWEVKKVCAEVFGPEVREGEAEVEVELDIGGMWGRGAASVTENECSLQESLARSRMFLERYKDSRDEEFGERFLSKIQRDELYLSEVRTRDRKLGRAFATSGLKVTPSGANLDWGLVLLNDGHSVVNEPLNDSPYDRRPSVYFTEVDDFTTFKPGCRVHKGGAASGWSRGRVNEIGSQVRLPGGPPEGTTECCAVGGDRHSPFSRSGDSGAWVTSTTGSLGGLLVGCHTAGGWGYVTPIQDVMEDIESSLGCEVVLPGELGSRYRYG